MSEKPPLRRWSVLDHNGVLYTIDAEFVFNNDGTLVFRRGPKGDSKVVASFAPGAWGNYLSEAIEP